MKKLLSLFLVLVTLLGILPTAAFAADSEEEALGEVNIYNGEYELGYLSINGSVRKQIYTYFLYEANDGTQKESRPTASTQTSTAFRRPWAPARASSIWQRNGQATPRWWALSPTATHTAAWAS